MELSSGGRCHPPGTAGAKRYPCACVYSLANRRANGGIHRRVSGASVMRIERGRRAARASPRGARETARAQRAHARGCLGSHGARARSRRTPPLCETGVGGEQLALSGRPINAGLSCAANGSVRLACGGARLSQCRQCRGHRVGGEVGPSQSSFCAVDPVDARRVVGCTFGRSGLWKSSVNGGYEYAVGRRTAPPLRTFGRSAPCGVSSLPVADRWVTC